MAMNSVRAQAQAGSNELVRMALAQQGQHFMFTLSQTGQIIGKTADGSGCDRVLEILPNAISNLLWRGLGLTQRSSERVEDLSRPSATKQVGAGPARSRAEQFLTVFV